LIIVPAVAWDETGHRVGYGGGFYDRLLARAADKLSIGIGFDCQVLPEVPREAHDLGVDMLATSGHKALFVPHGVGLFYCRRERLDDIAPFYVARSGMVRPVAVEHDAAHYELALAPSAARYEIGNNNYLGITVLNESLKFLLDLGMARIERRMLELSGYLTERLLAAGFEALSPREAHRRSAIVCVRVADPARVHAWLLARKVISTCRRDSLRLSLGIYNTEGEIDAFTDLLKAYPG
jgi:selenocysteine lyase/cysteine desulfurase